MSAMDLHVTLTAVTIASMLIGALVELLYRPARQRDVDSLRAEMRQRAEAHEAWTREQVDAFFNATSDIREEMRVRLAVLESRPPPPSS
jgi:hypothetical protein